MRGDYRSADVVELFVIVVVVVVVRSRDIFIGF